MTLETVGICRRQSSVTNCTISGSGDVMRNRSRKPRRGKMCCRHMSILFSTGLPCVHRRASGWATKATDSTLIDRRIVCFLSAASALRARVLRQLKLYVGIRRDSEEGGRGGSDGTKQGRTFLFFRYPLQCRRRRENNWSDAKCKRNEPPCCQQNLRYMQRRTERAVNHSLTHTHTEVPLPSSVWMQEALNWP